MSKPRLLALVILLTLKPCILLSQIWSTPIRVSPYTTDYYIILAHGLTTDGSGTPWCAWCTETHNPLAFNLFVSHSCDTAWSWPDTIYPFSGFFNCDLAADANGNVWVVAEDIGTVSSCFYDGTSWSNLMQVPSQGTCCHYPVAAGDTLGNMYVCWHGGGPGEGHHIWGNVYDNGQWGSPVLISYPGSPEESAYSMVMDKQGSIWVGWHWFTGPPAAAIYTAYNDGNSWSDTMIIAEYTYAAYGPALTVDTAGRVWAGWIHADSGAADYSVSASYYDGNAWSEPVLVSTGHFDAAIASDDKGIVWLTWCSPDHDIYYSYWNGIGWSDPTAVDVHPADDYMPKMTFDGDRIWVTWWSNREGFEGIYASYTYGLDVEENLASTPKPSLVLCQNCPNPFHEKTDIRYEIPADGRQESIASMGVYDIAGRLVKHISLPSTYSLLPTTVLWDGKDEDGKTVPSGVYWYRLDVGDFTATKKMLFIH